jgi:TRAP-type C4-dicarboxylate transport system permease small subunit
MKPSELFGVVVRTTGFLIFIYGLWEIWGGVENFAENLLAINQGDTGDQPSSLGFFAFGLPSLGVGALVFFLANGIVRLAYPRSLAEN